MTRPIHVQVEKKYPDEPVEVMLKRFRKLVKKEGIIEEARDRMYFQKPSKIRNERNLRLKKVLKAKKLEEGAGK